MAQFPHGKGLYQGRFKEFFVQQIAVAEAEKQAKRKKKKAA